MKTKNRILEIPSAAAATPPNPKIAANAAMRKKTIDQYNMSTSPLHSSLLMSILAFIE
jgi:hypothetical protein